LDYTLGYTLNSANTNFPGFQAVTVQIEPGAGTQVNDTRWAEQMLAGLGGNNDAHVASMGSWFANGANVPVGAIAGDTNYAFVNGWFYVPGTINMDISKGDGDFTSANGYPDAVFPGIPGNVAASDGSVNENFEVEFKTWVAFPSAGLYSFAVTSDDGFRVYEATNHGRLTGVNITSPTNYMIPAVPQFPDNGGTIGAFLPTTSLIAGKVVLGNPMTATNLATNLVNAAAVKGNIVMLSRGGFGGSQQLAYLAAQSGALALIEISNDAQGTPPEATLGGTNLGIPVLLISVDDGLALSNTLATTSTTINADLGDDGTSLRLAQYEGGRGFTDSDFSVMVPQAGLYPFRIVYEQGNGGGNMEFSQWVNNAVAGGVKNQVLVNDVAHGAVATFAKLIANPTPLPKITAIGSFSGITYSGNTVTVAWSGAGRLQQSSDVSKNTNWTSVAGVTGTSYSTTVTGPLFFRLILP